MTANRDEGTPRRAEDEEFAERLAASFSPAPLSPARRAAFDAALAERLEQRRRSRLLLPALAAAAGAAVAALAWLAAPGAFDPAATERGGADDVVAETSAALRWELELLDLNALTEADDPDRAERLPDDYAAIAGLFLDG
jgi:hypothetical protein